jgi:hypothetical protein
MQLPQSRVEVRSKTRMDALDSTEGLSEGSDQEIWNHAMLSSDPST